MDELVRVAQSPHRHRVRARVVSTASLWPRPVWCLWPLSMCHVPFSVAQQRVRAPRVETVARAARGTESGPGAEVGHKNPGSRALRGI